MIFILIISRKWIYIYNYLRAKKGHNFDNKGKGMNGNLQEYNHKCLYNSILVIHEFP